MKVGYIGLGKMGKNMVLRLLEQDAEVVAYNRSPEPLEEVAQKGAIKSNSVSDLVSKLKPPKIVWLMLPPGKVTQEHIDKLENFLENGDTIIDGSNNHFSEAKTHTEQLSKKKINFIDAGVSGGPEGARNGACLMVGGDKDNFNKTKWLFEKIAAPDAFQFFPGTGAGHFVKMVHNGIEYGMMQSIAEGFNLLKSSDYNLDLVNTARVYNKKSVIESRLVGWLHESFEKYGVELEEFGGTVGHLGEGQWTVEYAKEKGIPLEIIEKSLEFRIDSQENPSYTGKILQALRTAFGGKRSEDDKPYK